jgi:hypothetical protein
MLALKSTRLSQAGAREIDWGNPITRGLFFAHSGGHSVYGTLPFGPDSTNEIVSNRTGKALALTGAPNARTPLIAPVTSDSWTLFSVASNSQDSSVTAIFGVTAVDNVVRVHQHYRGWPNFGYGVDARPYAPDYNSSANFTVADGSVATAAVISSPRNRVELYMRGVLLTSAGLGSTWTVRMDDVQLFIKGAGAFSDPAAAGSTISIALAFSRDLSQGEILSLSLNPWQIFK